jgi:YVTN family beta-propeller protein
MRFHIAIVALIAAMFALPASAQIALSSPEGITFDSQGNLYVANYGTNQILIYNRDLVQISSISAGLSGPNRLAFDTLGNLYVSNGTSNSITVYDPNGNQIISKTITQGLKFPLGVAVDAAGNVFVANNSANNITVYNADGVLLQTLTRDDHHRLVAPGVMVVLNRHLYLGTGPAAGQSYTNSYETSLVVKGILKEVITYFDRNDEGPTGIAFDSEGNIYIDYFYTGTAAKYSPTNQLLLTINVGHFGNGEGIAVDKKGNIYIAFINVIYIYDSSGNLINTLH